MKNMGIEKRKQSLVMSSGSTRDLSNGVRKVILFEGTLDKFVEKGGNFVRELYSVVGTNATQFIPGFERAGTINREIYNIIDMKLIGTQDYGQLPRRLIFRILYKMAVWSGLKGPKTSITWKEDRDPLDITSYLRKPWQELVNDEQIRELGLTI